MDVTLEKLIYEGRRCNARDFRANLSGKRTETNAKRVGITTGTCSVGVFFDEITRIMGRSRGPIFIFRAFLEMSWSKERNYHV